MRDPQGREIIRTTTTMRAAFGSALETLARREIADPRQRHGLVPTSPLRQMVTEVYLSGAGRKKAPAWSIRRKGGRA